MLNKGPLKDGFDRPGGVPTNQVKDSQYSAVLLDDIEKANPGMLKA